MAGQGPGSLFGLFPFARVLATTTSYDLVAVADNGESRYKLTESTGRNKGPFGSIRFDAHDHFHSGQLIRLKGSLTPSSENRAVEVLDVSITH